MQQVNSNGAIVCKQVCRIGTPCTACSCTIEPSSNATCWSGQFRTSSSTHHQGVVARHAGRARPDQLSRLHVFQQSGGKGSQTSCEACMAHTRVNPRAANQHPCPPLRFNPPVTPCSRCSTVFHYAAQSQPNPIPTMSSSAC